MSAHCSVHIGRYPLLTTVAFFWRRAGVGVERGGDVRDGFSLMGLIKVLKKAVSVFEGKRAEHAFGVGSRFLDATSLFYV